MAQTEKYWKSDIPDRAYKLCLLGLTNEQLAIAFGASKRTIEYWYQHKDEFRQALDMGRQEADSKVALSLYKRATGYDVRDNDIKVYRGKAVITPFTKHYPPDVEAIKFWLKNRQPEKWNDTHKMEHTGHTTIELSKQDLSDISDQELEVLEKLGVQKLLGLNERT